MGVGLQLLGTAWILAGLLAAALGVERLMTLRVGMLAPISWRVPPRHYGPWEQFVSLLTEGLVARGVDVTLFATADSITRARLVGTAPTGYSEDPSLDAKVWEALHISAVFERAGGVRRDPQQLRLPAADATAASSRRRS